MHGSCSISSPIEFKQIVETNPTCKPITELEVTHKPISFQGEGEEWGPLLPNLWGRIVKGARADSIHFFDIKKNCEAYLKPTQREGALYTYLGLGTLDDCVVIVTIEGQLEFWKYQDNQMKMVSTIKINIEGECLVFGWKHIHIQRLSPDHISVIATKSPFESGSCHNMLFVINTKTNIQEQHRLPFNVKPVFLPSKVSPLKHYFLVVDMTEIKVIEINLDWRCRWSWFKDRGIVAFKQKGYNGWTKDISSSYVAMSHTSSFKSSSYETTNQLFAIKEENGRIAAHYLPQSEILHRSIPRDDSAKYCNNITLLGHWLLFQPNPNLYQCTSLSDPHLYKLAEESDEITLSNKFYNLSEDEIGVVSQDIANKQLQTVSCYETPACQFRKVEAFLLFIETQLPKPIASISAQYAFGLFAQKIAREAGQIDRRKEALATQERVKEERKVQCN